jgi:hypothetical protein
MNKFEFQPMEPHLKQQLQEVLARYQWLVPNWCARVVFRTGSDANNFATCYTRYDYRDCFIDIHPPFWVKSMGDKEKIVVHELVHNFFNPTYIYAADALDAIDPDAPHSRITKDTLMNTNESCTEDMTNAVVEFARKMYAKN